MGGEEIQARVLEEVGRKLVAMEEESIHKSELQFVFMDKTTEEG